MNFNIFDKNKVLKDLENKGYYIHIHTSPKGRTEADKLSDYISEYLNEKNGLENSEWNEDRIIVLNQEVPPSCNYGVIYRNDIFPTLRLIEDIYKEKLAIEIEEQR